MKYLMKYRIFLENKDYQETSWTRKINGEDVTITIHDIQDYLKDEPVVDILVYNIEDICIHKDKTDKETLERAERSNLKHPIIICKSGEDWGMILDGHHRLKKAIGLKEQTIKAKILDLDNSPEEYQIMFSHTL